MKKTLLTLFITIAVYCSYAQTNTFPTSGNVGIGTTSPGKTLDVIGTVKATSFNVKGTTANEVSALTGTGMGYSPTTYPVTALGIIAGNGVTSIGYNPLTNTGGDFSGDGSEVLFRNIVKFIQPNSGGTDFLPSTMTFNNGNVGIGTTSPTYKLSVVSTGTSANSEAAFFQAANGGYSAMAFTGDNSAEVGSMTTYNGYVFYGSQNTTLTGTNGEIGINTSNHNVILGGAALGGISGNVGIGTTDTKGYKLAINGSAIATSVTVKLNSAWPDYVFKPTYHVPSLTEVETYIIQNHHLPDMPSEADVAKDGLNLGEMNKLLTKKVEELTLYLIQQKEQMDKQAKILQEQINELKQSKH